MHWEPIGCKIPVCQLNSKGSAGSQTCISGVILIFIAGMVGFWRNSTTTNLVSLGHDVNTLEDHHLFHKHAHQKMCLSLFYWLKIENSLFTHVGFHCRIETTCVFTHLKVVTTILMELLQVVANAVVTQLTYNRI